LVLRREGCGDGLGEGPDGSEALARVPGSPADQARVGGCGRVEHVGHRPTFDRCTGTETRGAAGGGPGRCRPVRWRTPGPPGGGGASKVADLGGGAMSVGIMDAVGAARAVGPVVRAGAAEAEAARRLPPQVVAELAAGGLLRMAVP